MAEAAEMPEGPEVAEKPSHILGEEQNAAATTAASDAAPAGTTTDAGAPTANATAATTAASDAVSARDIHTFVLCAYKESPYLEECIRSLLDQSVCSTVLITTSTPNDHISQLAEKHGLEVRVKDGAPGIASDWNFALSQAQTPLVTIAHQDDVYLPGFARSAVEAFCESEDLLVHFTDYAEIKQGQRVDDSMLLKVKRALLLPMRTPGSAKAKWARRAALSLGSAICCPSVSINKLTCPQPLFAEGLASNLDWEAWERLSKLEGAFVYDPEVLMCHRIHEGSETSRILANNERTAEDLVMFKKFWPGPIARAINKVYALGEAGNQ